MTTKSFVAKIKSGRGSRENRAYTSTKSAFADYLQPAQAGFVIVAATFALFAARLDIIATAQPQNLFSERC